MDLAAKQKILMACAAFIIVLACFAVYSTSFGNTFIFDDIGQILNNEGIKSFKNIPAVFTHHLTFFASKSTDQDQGKFYRPIQSITLMLDNLLWGKEPFGYHLTNTMLHAIVCVLAFFFFLKITDRFWVSLMAGLLYAVHPLHTEAVTYISGRADSLCTIFLFFMIIFQRLYRSRTSIIAKAFYYILVSISFTLALLSKEYSMIFPFLLMLCGYFLDNDKGYSSCFNKKIIFYLPLFIIMGIWFVVKNAIVATETMVEEPASLATRLTTIPRLIYDYIRLSVFPTDLHMGYKLEFPRSLLQSGYFGPFIFTFLFTVFFIYTLLRGRRDRDYRIVGFGLSWFLLALLPYLNLIFQLNAPFAEHWIYVPAVGLALSVVYITYIAVRKRPVVKRASIFLFAMFFVAFSYKTMQQNLVWKDSFTFYSYTVKYAPFSESIYNNLAIEYIKNQEWDEAMKCLKRALEINPDYLPAKDNLRQLEADPRRRGMS
ncbi:MAG: tetratricopeptide repeat protein [Candidatus Omnitrophica bacterium]|nr:tetratricopeptide repeat protein [Candidatus Omnitrophota bacterium]